MKDESLMATQGEFVMAPKSLDNILVIAPKVPRPDMNSGDLRLFSILGILARGHEISFVTTGNRPGDDAYIRRLEQRGITVHAEPFSLRSLLESKRFKIAIMEFFFTAEYYLDRLRFLQPDCRVIVDSVDVHYLRLRLKYDLTKNATDHAAYLETKERELSVYRKADGVIAVTGDDAAAILSEVPDMQVELVPNIHEVCLGPIPAERNTLIFVGGFSHPPNVDAVLFFCGEVLPLITHVMPGIRVLIVGSDPPEQIRKLENAHIRVTGFVQETMPYLHQSTVSVAPLRYGAGMKGKIGEAMAHGVPVVTTSVGAQGMPLINRKNIMIADTPHDFAASILELLLDNQLYETLRNNAVRVIQENYTHERVARTMGGVLERINAKPARRMTLFHKLSFLQGYVTGRIKTRLSPC